MFYLKPDEIFNDLGSSKNGLSQEQIIKNKKKYGTNTIREKKREGFLKRFFMQFLNVMVLTLLFAAAISITMAIVSKTWADLFEGFVILFIVIVNAFIGLIQENKAEACLNELKKHDSTSCKVIRNGAIVNIESVELAVGDVVMLSAGDVVPADLRLFESNNLKCDESMLTGESLPTEKNALLTLPKHTSINEQNNMAFSGSLVVTGKGKGIVVQVGEKTEIGRIAQLIVNANKDLTPLQKNIAKIGKIITFSVLIICFLIFLIEMLFSQNTGLLSAIMSSVALAVAAIPESLPAVITIIMALGVQQLAKRKVIIKRLHAVETLGSCEIICSDKTGTLTQNKMTVLNFFCNDSFETHNGIEFQTAMNCFQICTEAQEKNNIAFGEPTEVALLNFAMQNSKKPKCKVIYEIPFDSTRKMMSIVVNQNNIISYTKGAFDRLIDKCSYIMFNGEKQVLTNAMKSKLQTVNDKMANDSLRVIACAFKEFDEFNMHDNPEENMTFLGLAGMLDPPRPEVFNAIKKCFSAGLKPIMITGDHKNTAFAIAKQLGIAHDEQQVLTGDEINKMTDKEFVAKLQNYTVFARVSPEHKVLIVSALKKCKKIVAMTGDGVNDAPSLKIADIGVGMGASGTDVVKSVADMLITDDNFANIVVAVEEGRKVFANIQKALQFLLSTNAVEVCGMLFALIFYPNLIFLIPSQMLFINLVTDSLPAFALGVEPPEKDIMERPPKKNSANIFSGKIGFAILYQSVLQVAIVLFIFVFALNKFDCEVATTMVFFTIIYMQLLHSINSKTNKSIFDINLLGNKTFNLCFVITLLINLFVSIMPFCYSLFSLTPLTLQQWIMVLIGAFAIIPSVEIVKMISNYDIKKAPFKWGKKNKSLNQL